MDLRTKLVFTLVAVALGSMLALGGVTYLSARDLLANSALEQLDGLAESKKESVEGLIAAWHERVQLIASRTQLRASLLEYNESGSSQAADRIQQIVADALNSARTLQTLAVFDQSAVLVASATRDSDLEIRETPAPPPPAGELSEFRGVFFDVSGEPRLVFVAGLDIGGQRQGVLRATLNASELAGLTRNVQGLGDTGETVLVARDQSGTARALTPWRHRPDVGSGELDLANPAAPANMALGGMEGTFTEGVIDYRGEPVWAATRFVLETGWGIVVKVDETEERASILEFRGQLTQLALTLSAFAILLATLIGLRYAKPIHELAVVARRLGEGEMEARAEAGAEDEIGLLAMTFNRMADELGDRMSELREFRQYFDFAPDMLCIAGTDGFFKRTNPAFERTLGWSEEQLKSKPFIEFVHPDDRASTLNEVEKLSEGIPTVSFENRYQCADGEYKTLLWTSHPDTESGLLYAAARDVSALRRTQKQLEAAEAKLRGES